MNEEKLNFIEQVAEKFEAIEKASDKMYILGLMQGILISQEEQKKVG